MFVGDHVMGWSTLDRGAAGRLDDRLHGLARRGSRRRDRGPVFLRPRRSIPQCAALRALPIPATARPAKPRSCIASAKGEADIPTMVRAIYIGLDPRADGCRRLFRCWRIWKIWWRAAIVATTDGDR